MIPTLYKGIEIEIPDVKVSRVQEECTVFGLLDLPVLVVVLHVKNVYNLITTRKLSLILLPVDQWKIWQLFLEILKEVFFG